MGALLDFNETEIKAKRQQAIKNMAEACEMGLRGENLSDYFDLYFNSKYAREKYLPTHTRQGKIFRPLTVWQYLAYMRQPPDGIGKERDNIKHLRGACARLLAASPDNGALLLLGAFATLYLELTKPDRILVLMESAQQQLAKGFLAYHNLGNLSLTDLVAFVQTFARAVGHYESRIADYVTANIEELLQLELHTRWLTDFNARFIDLPTSTATAE